MRPAPTATTNTEPIAAVAGSNRKLRVIADPRKAAASAVVRSTRDWSDAVAPLEYDAIRTPARPLIAPLRTRAVDRPRPTFAPRISAVCASSPIARSRNPSRERRQIIVITAITAREITVTTGIQPMYPLPNIRNGLVWD